MSDNQLTLKEGSNTEDSPINHQIRDELLDRVTKSDPSLFDGIADDKRRKIVGKVFNAVQGVSYSIQRTHMGPLPDPTTLAGYNNVVTGGGERVFIEFEKQANHRRDIEKRVIRCDNSLSVSGQILAFILALLFGGAGVFLVIKGYEIPGTILSSFDLVGLVSVFILGKYYQRRSLEDKE